MTTDQVNYQPLEQIKNSWKLVFKSFFKGKALVIVIILGVITLAAMILFPFVFIVFFIGIIVNAVIVSNKIKDQAWLQFAAANGWSIDITTPPTTLVPPSLQGLGYSQSTSKAIVATVNNINCEILTYQYSVNERDNFSPNGQDQSSTRTYFYTIAVVNLGKVFPHIILDSKKNDEGSRTIQLGYEKLKLEGDFDNYFRLYVSKGEEIDVLSIITPDVMQTLIDSETQQDIEINQNYLYFVTKNDARKPDTMKNLLQSVDKLTVQILQRAQSLDYKPATAQVTQPVPA